MSGVAKIITENGITLYYGCQVYTAQKSHINYDNLLKEIRSSNYEEFIKLLSDESKLTPIKKLLNNNFVVLDEKLYYSGRLLGGIISERIFDLIEDGHDTSYMEKFLDNLLKNPSSRAVEELYKFLENKNIPITEDGCFLAYRAILSNYYSKHANRNLILISGRYNEEGRIYNGIGQVIECERNCVSDNPKIDCGKGLHVGGLSYAGPGGTYFGTGDRTVIVKVNPKDVVTIPYDDSLKIRVCKYEVIGEYTGPLPSTTTAQPVPKKVVVEEEAIEPTVKCANLEVGNNIKFFYKGEIRYAQVRSFNGNVISMILLYKDPSFDANKVSYRNFIDTEIYGVELY